MNPSESCEYRNDFLFFVLRPHKTASGTGLLYCSGVNIDRFLPITRGRHRPMSNPAIRGLQLVNLGVRALCLSKGAKPRTLRGVDCAAETPGNDSWSTEHLLIENAPASLAGDIVSYAVVELLKKIDRAIMLGAAMPDTLLSPDELQAYLGKLCDRYDKRP